MGGDRNIRIDVNPGSFTHVCRLVLTFVRVLKKPNSFLAGGIFCHLLIAFANSLDQDQV